jgi:molybdopterin molybdotransferase
MISFNQGIELIRNQAKLVMPVRIKTEDSLAMVCAQPVLAQRNLPAFNSAAMDGFAVCANQTLLATPDSPLNLPVSHRIDAGALTTEREFGPSVEITTGAVVPDAFDAVIAYEQVHHIERVAGLSQSSPSIKSIELRSAAYPHQNIRLQGEDLKLGSVLLEPGTRIHAGHMAAMAASGVSELYVRPMPAVDIFSTGAEVKTLGTKDAALHCGEIYDSNTPYLLTEMKAAGIKARHAASVGDDPDAFAERIKQPSEATILISTGGVSQGPRDFIAEALTKLGARILFHGVAIKPGKPVLFAVLPDGRYFFGLPGNPIATAMGLRFFVMPLIRQMLGMAAEIPTKALITEPYLKKGTGAHLLKARRFVDTQGILRTTLLNDQSAFSVSSLMTMTGWVMVPDTINALPTNAAVDYFGMELMCRDT